MPKKKAKLPLSKTHPKLAKEAVGWDPSTLTAGSNKKVSWICPKGHKWQCVIYDRINKSIDCQVCANRIVLKGFNDLLTTHPKLAQEAFGWDPTKFHKGMAKRVSWRCKKKHKWDALITSRTFQNQGCPYCSNKKILKGFNDLKTTHPNLAKEAIGWDPTKISYGSSKKFTWTCNKKHKWIATVAARSRKNGTECPICQNRKLQTNFNDLKTLYPKIANEAYGWDPTQVLVGSGALKQWKCSKGHIYKMRVSAKTNRGSGCSVCTGKVIHSGFNDLATKFPTIANEAHGWDPKKVMPGSHVKLKWKCSKGHLFEMAPHSRTTQDQGCKYCSGRAVLKGFNDLKTTHPNLAKESYMWDPNKVSAGSHKKLAWKCKLGHIFSVSPNQRTSNTSNCPFCGNKKLLKGFNDLSTTHPDIAKQAYGWDPTKIIGGSTMRLKWTCSKSHIWESSSINRISNKTGCPICENQLLLTGYNDLQTTHPELSKEAHMWDPTKVISGSKKRYKWKCDNGHIWIAPVGARSGKSSTGCPSCSKSGFDPNKSAWIYFALHADFNLLQIGITNKPEDRIQFHQKFNWEIIELRGPMDGHLTQQWETAILKMLRANGAKMGQRKENLYKESKIVTKRNLLGTEIWDKSSFPVNSITELMQLTEEFEEKKGNKK